MMRQLLAGALAGVTMFATIGCDDDETGPDNATQFEASLTGSAERPDPVTTTATGSAEITINESAQTISYSIDVSNLVNPTVAHIHIGSANEAGAPVALLLATPPAAGTYNGELVSGTVLAADIMGGLTFSQLVDQIRNGTAYVNVHTVAYPNGEIRGQLSED